jgi:hypothetical protein
VTLLLMDVARLNLRDVDDLDPDALDEIMAAYEARSQQQESDRKAAQRRR